MRIKQKKKTFFGLNIQIYIIIIYKRLFSTLLAII